MIGRLPLAVAGLALAAGCSSARHQARPAPSPNVDPAPVVRTPAKVPSAPAAPPAPPVERVAPPEAAAANDWMPLASTGVTRFRREHPGADGRGVLIAILDTGVDPAVPGLAVTSTGTPKLADLRDFSGEGAVPLGRVQPAGDSVTIGGRRLGGFGRVRALNNTGPWYGGAVVEHRLGVAPAADLDGDGAVGDTLPLLVTRSPGGWVVLADRDGDGSLAGERPVGDFLRAREWFGWAPPGRSPPVGVAANLEDADGEPRLALVFDLDSHGTHVAGIAGGHEIYGVAGLDGVAPGAQLLGLKIANSAQGSVSTTGAILRALDYAIGFAAARRQPLVVNLSFGVGNEIEGTATVDRLIDSVLRRHPETIMTVSAGNDGPGLSTVGFPGSAGRAVTVGAIIPRGFLPPAAGGLREEPVAFFSARGGELAKPDVVAPGVAYSTVPRWNAGDEIKQGTSMAAPHVAGMAAVILAALGPERRAADGPLMRRGLMVTATPVDGAALVEGGRGVPSVEATYRWLLQARAMPEVDVGVPGGTGDAVLLVRDAGDRGDTTAVFLLRNGGREPRTFALRSETPWLRPPERVVLRDTARVEIPVDLDRLPEPGAYTATVSGWTADTLAGPAFRLPVTVVRPARLEGADSVLRSGVRVPAGRLLRSFVRADSARPFAVRVTGAAGNGLAFLHEPHGRPFRGGGTLALTGGQAAVFQVDGRDAVAGIYEADVTPAPGGELTATVELLRSPVSMQATRTSDRAVQARLANLTGAPVRAEVGLALRGTEQVRELVGRGPEAGRLPLVVPGWAHQLRVEVTMPRAQWSRFTDFGVTLFDSAGRRLETGPLQYAGGRLTLTLEPGGTDRVVHLALLGGLADPADTNDWRVAVSVRSYAVRDIALTPADAGPLALGPGAEATRDFTLPEELPPAGEGSHPLAALLVTTGERRWTREITLPLQLRNTMR